ncbi:MAG: NAD(P)H-hydrate dehydratase [Kiritimatiellaeota bacterium]|nr:NAD(P)H-hydrate dehydratase [Kiritimatiellota bacterium]
MKIISVITMRSLDRRTIQAGTPGEVLMDRAGTGAARIILDFVRRRLLPRHAVRFTVLAGKGNNGGDAWVVARRLAEAGAGAVHLYSVCPAAELKDAARKHAEALPDSVPVSVSGELPEEALTPGTVVVDGLLGTGAAGPVRPPYDRLIAQVNASGMPVAALDVPSGLDADTGAVASLAVRADLTATMALPKRGLLTPAGIRHCGRLYCVDIGVPPVLAAEVPGCGEALFLEDVRQLVGRRPHDGHKGTFGHVLTVGGSRRYAGAPLLAGIGALRAGAGLSTVLVPASVRMVLPHGPAALIIHDAPDDNAGRFTPETVRTLSMFFDRKQAVVVGPGLDRHEGTAAVLDSVLGTNLPLVIDADALRFLGRFTDRLRRRRAATVLTPHPGEMRSVLASLGRSELCAAARVQQATEAARSLKAFVVLKGAGTVVARPDGQWVVNTSGANGLGSGGAGDVLAGILGGLLAQGMTPWDASRVGVFLHGLAAEFAPAGQRALTADDLTNLIGRAWQEITPFA